MIPNLLLDLCAIVTIYGFVPLIFIVNLANRAWPLWRHHTTRRLVNGLILGFFLFVFWCWLFLPERFGLVQQHQFVFSVMTGGPFAVLIWVMQQIISRRVIPTTALRSRAPDWMWNIHAVCAPAFAGAIGFVMAICLSSIMEQKFSVQISTLARNYAFWFVVSWCPVFWYLNLFYTAAWSEAGSGSERSTEEWLQCFLVRGVVEQYPSMFPLSFCAGFLLTGVAMLIGEGWKCFFAGRS